MKTRMIALQAALLLWAFPTLAQVDLVTQCETDLTKVQSDSAAVAAAQAQVASAQAALATASQALANDLVTLQNDVAALNGALPPTPVPTPTPIPTPTPSPTTILTPGPGSLVDAAGNIWAYKQPLANASAIGILGDTCDMVYTKNGSVPYGGAGAAKLVIYKGILHQFSCIYGWYHDTGTSFAADTAADVAVLNALQ